MPDSFQSFVSGLRRNWPVYAPLIVLCATTVGAVAVARAQIDDHDKRLDKMETAYAEQSTALAAIKSQVDFIRADVLELRGRGP